MAEYIDRQAFIEEKRNLYCESCEKRKGMKNGKQQFVYEIGDAPCRACEVDDMFFEIEEFPPADVHPVKHGKWIIPNPESDEQVYCSLCNWHVYGDLFTPYCPGCGARMDGET